LREPTSKKTSSTSPGKAIPRAKRFYESQTWAPGVPEWNVVFILASEGPQNKYEIARGRSNAYPSVHNAVKKLVQKQWVESLQEYASKKNLRIRKYGLTVEGLLWVLSRIPKSIDPETVDEPLPQYFGFGKKGKPQMGKLSSQMDVHQFLIFEFDAESALERSGYFPLAFEYRNPGELGERHDSIYARHQEFIPWRIAEIAFSSLTEYYFGYEGLRRKLEHLQEKTAAPLSLIFSYKLYEERLRHLDFYYDSYTTTYEPTLKKRLLDAIVKGCKDREVHWIIDDILKKIEEDSARQRNIITDVRKALEEARTE